MTPAIVVPSRRLILPRPRRWKESLAAFLDMTWKGGHILRTKTPPYHLSQCASGGGGGPAPCTCAWPTGLSASYTVSGFGGLSTCSTCDSSSATAWSGQLNHTGSGCIWWGADASFDPLSINGKMLDITYTQLLLNTTSNPCRWELYIACTSLTFPTKTMWAGYKTTGSTPAGTFSFVSSDCGNSTPTMTVA